MFKLIVLISCLAYATATVIQSCGGDIPTPTEVRVEGCDIPPCTFVQGDTVEVQADYTSDVELTTLTIVAKARIGEAEIILPMPDPDACNALVGSTCPVPPGTPITVVMDVFVDPIVPPMEAVLQVSVLDANEVPIVCFEGEVVVVPAK